jgi:hypothetical protein
MKPLTRADVRGPALYEGFRDDLRRRIIELKKVRRIDVGDRVTLVFENRHTLLFQVEEMLRAERITEPDKVQDELDVYNALMPDARSLSATLLIAVSDEGRVAEELDSLVGLDEHVLLRIGDRRVRAAFEPGRADAERIAAVQYIRFPLDDATRGALRTPGTPVGVEIDHPAYRAAVDGGEPLRRSLARDLDD